VSDRLEAAIRELAAAIRDEVAGAADPTPAPARLLDVDEAKALLGIGRTALYAELDAGRLTSLKVGRRRLISAAAIAAYIADRQAAA
jgi:excisionase family DNA binding protein